jgi:hypothetical protein
VVEKSVVVSPLTAVPKVLVRPLALVVSVVINRSAPPAEV